MAVYKHLRPYIEKKIKLHGTDTKTLYSLYEEYCQLHDDDSEVCELETYKRTVRRIVSESLLKDEEEDESVEESIEDEPKDNELEKESMKTKIEEKSAFVKSLKDDIAKYKSLYEEQSMILNNVLLSSRKSKDYIPIREYDNNSEKIAVLQISDVHYGKVVDFKGDDALLNKYDKDIARKRLQKVFDETIEYVKLNKIENVIVALEGDMFSGIIHDELKYNVNTSVMDDVYSLADCLSHNIRSLVKSQLNVRVIGVSGNHGRISQKFEFEFMATNNFDFLLYKILKGMNNEIDIEACETTSKIMNIVGKNYIFHHGNFTRSGKNLSGAPSFTASRDSSFMSNKYKKMGYNNIEAILYGHFHTLHYLPGLNIQLLGNGSVIGTDSYSNENVLIGDASQNLVIIDRFGIRNINKIYLNDIMN